MSFELELQKAIYSALTGDSNVTNKVVDVYDYVPQPDDAQDEADFPYITIGETSFVAFDHDQRSGSRATVSIHVWSRYEGRKEVKEIQGAVYDNLHRRALSVSGYNTITVDFLNSESLRDPDGETFHGVQEFQVLLMET